jgi:hypothetical protein
VRGGRAHPLGAAAIVALATAHALAAPPAPQARKTPVAEAPTLPPPPLTLAVTPGAGGAPWRVRVENPGELPVRIAADPRLLELEVTAPSGDAANRKPVVRCTLPDDARPTTDEGHELVVPGKRSWTTAIDPIFLCFGARERAALVAGASVKPSFGWSVRNRGRAPAPPFAATPVGAAVGVLAPAKAIEGAPFTLSDAVPAGPGSAATATAAGAGPRNALALTIPDALDIARGVEIPVTVTAANETDRAVTTFFRPEVVAFRVSGPGGSLACGTPRTFESPIRELFQTIPARGRSSLSLLVTAMCPPDTFDEPGVYRVFAKLDTTGASGRAIGMRTSDGVAETTTPMLLRVRTPRRPQPPTHPVLDP